MIRNIINGVNVGIDYILKYTGLWVLIASVILHINGINTITIQEGIELYVLTLGLIGYLLYRVGALDLKIRGLENDIKAVS